MSKAATGSVGSAKQVRDRIVKARVRLQLHYPFYAALVVNLDLQEDHSCPSMGTDGRVLAYNPEWVSGLNDDEVFGFVVHETLHCVFLHPSKQRRGTRDPWIWNLAADLIVNRIILEDEKLTLSKGALRMAEGELPRETTTEELYNKLFREAEKFKARYGSGSERDDHGAWGRPGGYKDADEEGGLELGGDGFDETVWKERTRNAEMVARMRGKMPGFLEQQVADVLNPPLDWRTILHPWIEELIKSDYKLFPFNRHKLWVPLLLPSLSVAEDGRVEGVMAIDTSGSVNDHDVSEFVRNVRSVVEQFGDYRLTVIQCDAKVQKVDVVTSFDGEVPKRIKGRGGTSFVPPFEYVQKHGIRCPWMVYFTDGEGPFPSMPEWPTIWVMTTEVKPPFGTVIKMRQRPSEEV